MADGAIVFAMANPTPEVLPEEIEDCVAVIGDRPLGLSEPDQQRARLPRRLPGRARRARVRINEEMKLAAARGDRRGVKPDELEPDYVIPSVFNREVAPLVAEAVAQAAEASGVTRRHRAVAQPG